MKLKKALLQNNSAKILQLSSSGCCGWVVADIKTLCEEQPCLPSQAAAMWAPRGATHPWCPPGSSQQSPWVLEEATCLKSQIIYCLACVLSFHTKEMAETQPTHRTAGKHHSALHPIRSCCWRDTAHQGPASPTNKILPTSTGHTLAARKTRESHSCPTSPMGICRQLLLPPAVVGKSCTLPWRGVTIHPAKVPQTGFLSAALGEYTTRHYQKLWVRNKWLFLSDSLLFNSFTKIFGCKTFLLSLELIKTCQSTASFDCSFCNLTPHRETWMSLPKSSHQIHKYSERTLIFTI